MFVYWLWANRFLLQILVDRFLLNCQMNFAICCDKFTLNSIQSKSSSLLSHRQRKEKKNLIECICLKMIAVIICSVAWMMWWWCWSSCCFLYRAASRAVSWQWSSLILHSHFLKFCLSVCVSTKGAFVRFHPPSRP